jgi:hypothetical protein
MDQQTVLFLLPALYNKQCKPEGKVYAKYRTRQMNVYLICVVRYFYRNDEHKRPSI